MHLGLRNHAHAAAQHQPADDEGVQPLPPRGQACCAVAPQHPAQQQAAGYQKA